MNKDVAIDGASSAGLFTANLLAQKGLSVKVFEAKDIITLLMVISCDTLFPSPLGTNNHDCHAMLRIRVSPACIRTK